MGLAAPPPFGAMPLLLSCEWMFARRKTMRPWAALADLAAGDITPAVLAIGRPDFPNVLIDTLRRQAGVGHCMVFALTRAGAASCLLDAGNIPIGGDLGAAYAGQFHEFDPNRDALFDGRERGASILLPAFAP